MSRVKIEDLSVERTLGADAAQVRGGGGFRVSVGRGRTNVSFRSGGGGGQRHNNFNNFNQFQDHHPHNNVQFHDTSHYEYIPGQYIWDCDHYDYVPGHWDLHQTGNFHH